MGGESRGKLSVHFYCACGHDDWWEAWHPIGDKLPKAPDRIECKKCKGVMFRREDIIDMQKKLAEIYQHQ